MATPTVLAGDRTIEAVPCTRHPSPVTGHCYEVTDAWLQEQYELVRGLRFHLEQCVSETGEKSGMGEKGVIRAPGVIRPAHASRITGQP